MKIGIRREDKNEWEARTPLIPEHIKELRQNPGLEFFIQPSSIRTYSNDDYTCAGAVVQEDLSDCDIVFGVKEFPIQFLQPSKPYIFFSHTIKGQSYNMAMLKRLVELKDTLIDYEKIVDDNGQRLVFFGRFAGIAGTIDTFWAFGQRLQSEGVRTPFAEIRQARFYADLGEAKSKLKSIGEEIVRKGFPHLSHPLIFGVTGYGNVSRGAQEILDLFPVIEIQPQEVASLWKNPNFSRNHIYKVVFKEEHIVKPIRSGMAFDLQDYYKHPEKYESKFEDYMPYPTVIINAIYWDKMYPRLVTKKYLKTAEIENRVLPLKVIGDITCDVEGSIECNIEDSNPGNPVYVYEPMSQTIRYGYTGKGIVVLAVDNLPCELPKESSAVFSNVLKKFIPSLVKTDFSAQYDALQLSPELKRATILLNGEFTPTFKYMEKFVV
jgi:alpha-aminoadipic semialdehyde synthase